MKAVLKITWIVCLMFVLMAEDCNNTEALHEKTISEERNRLANHFQADFLTEGELYNYQLSAKQKILDLNEYLKILCDTSLQMPFREKAGEMVRNTFISDTLHIKIVEEKSMTVSNLIDQALQGKLEIHPVICDSLWVKKMFYPFSPEMYYACLTETGVASPMSSQKCNKSIEAWITRQKKAFHNDTLRIWELRLGKIF